MPIRLECLNVFPEMIFCFVDALETVFDALEALPQFDNIRSYFGGGPLALHNIHDQRTQALYVFFFEASPGYVLETYPETRRITMVMLIVVGQKILVQNNVSILKTKRKLLSATVSPNVNSDLVRTSKAILFSQNLHAILEQALARGLSILNCLLSQLLTIQFQLQSG